MTPYPAMRRQTKTALGALEVARWQPRLHEFAHQKLAAPRASINKELRINPQHELDEAVIQEWRAYFERVPPARAVDLYQESPRGVGIDVEPAQLRQRLKGLTPELAVEPIVVVIALEPCRMQQSIDLLGGQSAEGGGKPRQTGECMTLHRLPEPRQRRQPRCKSAIEARGARADGRPVARVAAEDLIAPLAAQRDGHVAARATGNQKNGPGGTVGEGLIKDLRDRVQPRVQIGTARAHRRVARTQMSRDRARRIRLGALIGFETQRKCARSAQVIGGQRRIHATAQEYSNRHVAQRVLRHHGAQQRVESFKTHLPVAQANLERWLPIALNLKFAILPAEPMPGGKLRDALINRLWGGNVAVKKKIPPCTSVDRSRAPQDKGLQFRGKGNSIREHSIVQRLDAQPIARREKLAALLVPYREGEHAHKLWQATLAVARQEVQQNLGVAVGMQWRVNGRAQGVEIVELAVIGEDMGAELHRLRACRSWIEDGEPAMREGNPGRLPDAVAVGSAVRDPRRHGLRRVRASLPTDDSGDTAHPHRLPEPRYIHLGSTFWPCAPFSGFWDSWRRHSPRWRSSPTPPGSCCIRTSTSPFIASQLASACWPY